MFYKNCYFLTKEFILNYLKYLEKNKVTYLMTGIEIHYIKILIWFH